jgi:hypothetical protein
MAVALRAVAAPALDPAPTGAAVDRVWHVAK